jgi:group I intron endonuclease
MNKMHGEIYLIRNKTNQKSYIGQALKEVGGIIRQKWGAQGRWKSHVTEALKGGKDHCTYLNNAIRKYGEENFEVTVLCECADQEEMNQKEDEYIKQYNTMAPDGYNLREGGAKGKASEESRKKQSESRTGMKHSEQTKENISKGQLGNRRGTKARKYPEDANLPKYIAAKRVNDVIVGYAVQGFPTGITNKTYENKGFRNAKNPQTAYEKAIQYLATLEEAHKDIGEKIKDTRQAEAEPVAPKATGIKLKVRKSRKDKIGMDKYDMPQFVTLRRKQVGDELVEIGFEVGSINALNPDGTVFEYRASFVHPLMTMEEKLTAAKENLREAMEKYVFLIPEHENRVREIEAKLGDMKIALDNTTKPKKRSKTSKKMFENQNKNA